MKAVCPRSSYEAGLTDRVVPRCALLTDRPVWWVVGCEFLTTNGVPDAGKPMCENGKHRHQQCQHDDAILRVPVELLHQACQSQLPRHFEHVYQRVLSVQPQTYTLIERQKERKRVRRQFNLSRKTHNKPCNIVMQSATHYTVIKTRLRDAFGRYTMSVGLAHHANVIIRGDN